MGKRAVVALRIVLGLVLAGSLFVQVVMVPLLVADLEGGDLADLRVPLVVIVVLGIATIQVTAVCVWRLLSMVRRGTVFSHAAFRYVDVVIGAASAASLLTFAFAVTLALANRTMPGDAVAPGVVLLICGAAVIAAGIALIVLVLRMLLAQAIARDAEADHLQAELDEVI
jgi:Protein of unknown function (DUF2975)